MMMRRFEYNRILTAVAYNAGPSRADRWLDQTLPLDVWIEIIPFPETRNYVQNVLMFAAIYAYLMDLPDDFLTEQDKALFKP